MLRIRSLTGRAGVSVGFGAGVGLSCLCFRAILQVRSFLEIGLSCAGVGVGVLA